MNTMKSLQVVNPGSFEPVSTPIPELDASLTDSLLIKTGWVSLCGSDIPFFTGNKRNKSYPLPAGAPIHECVGEVVKSTSVDFLPGDHVVAIPEGDRGLAQFFVAYSSKTVKLPPDLPDNGTACLVQPLSTVLNALDRLGVVEGKSVAVIGLGSIGLFFCWLLAQRGAASIIGVDPLAERCQLAEKLGATRTYPGRSIELVHASRQAGGGWQPPDICIEAVGHQMDTLNDCIDLVRKRGTVLAFGVPDQPVYALEYETFFRKNAHLLAVVTPDWKEYLEKARDIFLVNQGVMEKMVTHRLPIREAGKVFTLYEQHADGIIKAVLDASAW